LTRADFVLEARLSLLTAIQICLHELLGLLALSVRVVAAQGKPAQRLEQFLDRVELPSLPEVVVPQDFLVPVLVDLPGDEILDQLSRLGPERRRVRVIEVVEAIVDEAQDLGRLLRILASYLLENAIRTLLNRFKPRE